MSNHDDNDNTKQEDNNDNISDNNDDEFRSHSFRERRLTYSRHHILSDTAAAAVAELLAEGADFSEEDDRSSNDGGAADNNNDGCNETIEVSAVVEKGVESSPSLPAAAAFATNYSSSPQQQQHGNNNKRRRGSSFSINSDSSSKPSTTTSYYLPSRILHAGEIVRRYSNNEHSSPVSGGAHYNHMNIHNNNGITDSNNNNTTTSTHEVRTGAYPHPTHFATSKTHHHSQHRNKWRQRFSFCSTTPDHILPFPRHVVGTFSCHGMEPVYDSDYDNNSDDSEDNNVQGGKSNNTSIAKINQDRGGIIYPYANSTNMALFAVYDGHGEGGELVSQYALGEVSRILSRRLVEGLMSGRRSDDDKSGGGRKRRRVLKSVNETSTTTTAAAAAAAAAAADAENEDGATTSTAAIEQAKVVSDNDQESAIIEQSLKETFITVDRGLLDEEEIEPMYSGTTACVVLKRHQRLYISNCGDSRAVLARRNSENNDDSNGQTNGGEGDQQTLFTTIPLSIDQNPDSPGEKERILDSGGFVSPPPEPGLTARVWLDSNMTQIGLAMARSIGDHAVKGVGVIAEPVVSVHDIDEELDDFVIIATDGVWEFISSEEAVDIVGKYLYDTSSESGGGDASEACEALIKAATAKWHEFEGDYRDDITAMVIRLKDLSCAA